MQRELCWLITSKCNANCKFCHFFDNKYEDLSLEQNSIILNNLYSSNITHIVWSGGEALQYVEIEKLLKKSHELKIINSVISNGYLPLYISNSIFENIDELVLSLDSINDKTNTKIGRGHSSRKNVCSTMKRAKATNPNIKIRINSVISKANLNEIEEIAEFINKQDINSWRLHKFAPIRAKALLNKDEFEITNTEYNKAVNLCKKTCRDILIETRYDNNYNDMYILITPNGDIIKTNNYIDEVIGKASNLEDLKKSWQTT